MDRLVVSWCRLSLHNVLVLTALISHGAFAGSLYLCNLDSMLALRSLHFRLLGHDYNYEYKNETYY
jgi:hypothetical protein